MLIDFDNALRNIPIQLEPNDGSPLTSSPATEIRNCSSLKYESVVDLRENYKKATYNCQNIDPHSQVSSMKVQYFRECQKTLRCFSVQFRASTEHAYIHKHSNKE